MSNIVPCQRYIWFAQYSGRWLYFQLHLNVIAPTNCVSFYNYYEGEPANWTQLDIKRKTCDIRTWKKYLFLDISSTNIDTFAPSLYQCFETRSIEVFLLFSQSLPHLRFNLFFLERISLPSCEPLYATNTSNCKEETFLYEYPLHWVLLSTKKNNAQRNLIFGSTSSSTSTILTAGTRLWTSACYLLSILSWSSTLLLPSGTYRKLVTSISAVLLPFVTYLLIFPRLF
jgi:hypothetical protein